MCGIFGFSRVTPLTRNMAPLLAWEMESRGKHSWGVSNGVELLHKMGPITESWTLPDWGGSMIFHTRQASVGAISIENAHPFKISTGEGTFLVGVHNGGVSNWQKLNAEYSRDFAVDSTHIFAHLAENRPMADIHGYGAIAWILGRRVHLLHFNGGSLEVVKFKSGEVVFASTLSPILKSGKMFGGEIDCTYKLDSETVYYWDQSYSEEEGWTATELLKGEPMRFGFRSSPTTVVSHTPVAPARTVVSFPTQTVVSAATHVDEVGATSRKWNQCGFPKCNVYVKRETALVCDAHLANALEKVLLDLPEFVAHAYRIPGLHKILTGQYKFRFPGDINATQTGTPDNSIRNPPDPPAKGLEGNPQAQPTHSGSDNPPGGGDSESGSNHDSSAEIGDDNSFDRFAGWSGEGY